MSKENNLKIRLQGHEKFALREGWLTKGLRLVKEEPRVFLEKDAPDKFGIGTNMVKSLRYWMKTFGLVEEKVGKGAFLTSLGELIYKYDEYFEDVFTLWVLHSNIARNLNDATAWYMFFNRCELDDVEKTKIEQILHREILKHTMGTPFSENSLRNDIDVILNMYSKNKGEFDPEDKNISPFVQLGLIKENEGRYQRVSPDRRSINEWNVLFELSFLMETEDNISIDSIVSGERSIGAIYHLGSIAINEILDRLDTLGYVRVNRTAGLDVVYKIKPLESEQILEYYYKEIR